MYEKEQPITSNEFMSSPIKAAIVGGLISLAFLVVFAVTWEPFSSGGIVRRLWQLGSLVWVLGGSILAYGHTRFTKEPIRGLMTRLALPIVKRAWIWSAILGLSARLATDILKWSWIGRGHIPLALAAVGATFGLYLGLRRTSLVFQDWIEHHRGEMNQFVADFYDRLHELLPLPTPPW